MHNPPPKFNFKMDYMPAATFDNRLYICLTCHKSVSKGKIPCPAVCNKLEVEAAPKVLQDLRRLERVPMSRRILFKKIAIMYGKGEFSKIKGNICNFPIETETACNVLQRPINNNELITVILKRHLRYREHVCFEPVRPESTYTTNFMKTYQYHMD